MEQQPAITVRIQALIGLALLFFSIGFSVSPWGQSLECVLYDSMVRLRGTRPQPDEVVIAAIDEPSFAVLGKQWPWPRDLHARLIKSLYENGAAAVALDIIFSEPSNVKEDQRLARSIKNYPGVVLASGLEQIEETLYTAWNAIVPLPDFTGHGTIVGADSMPLDPDGFIRRSFLTHGEANSFALAAALSLGRKTGSTQRIQASVRTGNEFFINYYGPPRSIKTVSYYQALDQGNHLPDNFFKDKLVFVGFLTKHSPVPGAPHPDHYPYPFVRFGTGYLPGVEIQATIAANLISNDVIRPVKHFLFLPFALALWLLAAFSAFRMPPLKSWILFFGTAVFALAVCYLLLSGFNLYTPLLLLLFPALALTLFGPLVRYYVSLKEKRFIRSTFSRYLSPAVVTHLLKQPDRLKPGGDFFQGTVLFLDIEGFTALTHRLPATKLVSVLSRYLGCFSDIVLEKNGMMDKIAGDAIMAVWGVPVARADHGSLACLAALKMKAELARMQKEDKETLDKPLSIRIGINSGELLAGNVGGNRFFNYTVHGVDVNFAVRLEAVNKIYKTGIIIGQNSMRELDPRFVLREIDTISVQGNPEPQTIHELLGLKDLLEEKMLALTRIFSRGRYLYKQGCWAEARTFFEKGLALCPDDGPCRLYIERCRSFEKNSPDTSWDGVSKV